MYNKKSQPDTKRKNRRQINNAMATQNFGKTLVAGRLRTVRWNDPNGLVMWFTGVCPSSNFQQCSAKWPNGLNILLKKSLWTWARVQTARSTAYFNGRHYIFLIYFYITIHVCVLHFYDLSTLVGCWSSVYIRRIIYKFLNVCPFDYTAVAVSERVGYP